MSNDYLQYLRTSWPHPPRHPLDSLRHVLDVADHEDGYAPGDDEMAVRATLGIYSDSKGRRVDTGLTWGDLRAIRRFLDQVAQSLEPLTQVKDQGKDQPTLPAPKRQRKAK